MDAANKRMHTEKKQEQDYCCCGLKNDIDYGPVHKYLASSPSCWAKFGEVLAREYENHEYMSVHALTVDAYALQHPGQDNPQTRNSANVHLGSLYGYFKLGKSVGELSDIKQALTKQKTVFTWLKPPDDLTEITVADVLAANTASEHCDMVKKWAAYIFNRWEMHHPVIADLLENVDT